MKRRSIGAVATLVLVAVLAATLTLTTGAAAQAPADAEAPGPSVALAALRLQISYQGRLTSPSSGQPVRDGTYSMTFSIYTVSSGGSPSWTETKNVAVSNGLFTTLLGDTTALSTSLFNGQALWLGVKVGSDPEASPRQPLAVVPYAAGLMPGTIMEGSDFYMFTASSTNSYGVRGISSASSFGAGVLGQNSGGTGDGVQGLGNGRSGVFGYGSGSGSAGVYGLSDSGSGVYGETRSTAAGARAIHGLVSSSSPGSSSSGVRGENRGTGGSGIGVWGSHAGSGWGIYGSSVSGYGIYGNSTNNIGIVGSGGSSSASGYGGYFVGYNGLYASATNSAGRAVLTNGTLQVSGAGEDTRIPAGNNLYNMDDPDDTYLSVDDNFQITGTCLGCTMAFVGQNDDGVALEPGDLVAISGVSGEKMAGKPVLRVRRASGARASAILGVVEGHYQPDKGGDGTLAVEAVAPGSYLTIITHGIASVKVDASTAPIQPGDLLVAASSGAATKAPASAKSDGTVIGKALEPLASGTGSILVLITAQ